MATVSDRTPTGIHIGLGVGLVLAAVMVSASLPAGGWRLLPVAIALVALGLCTADPVAVAAVAVVAYLLVVGFLVNQFGVLSWHGMPDAYRLAAVAASAATGVAGGAVRHWSRQRRRFLLPPGWSAGEPASAPGFSRLFDKEDVPGG